MTAMARVLIVDDDPVIRELLASYLQRGEAECFYMQTFSFVPGLNPDLNGPQVWEAYNIISTPGNTLFTTTFMAVFGLHSFLCFYPLRYGRMMKKVRLKKSLSPPKKGCPPYKTHLWL